MIALLCRTDFQRLFLLLGSNQRVSQRFDLTPKIPVLRQPTRRAPGQIRDAIPDGLGQIPVLTRATWPSSSDGPAMRQCHVLMRVARNPQGSTPLFRSAPVVRFDTCTHCARMWQPKNLYATNALSSIAKPKALTIVRCRCTRQYRQVT